MILFSDQISRGVPPSCGLLCCGCTVFFGAINKISSLLLSSNFCLPTPIDLFLSSPCLFHFFTKHFDVAIDTAPDIFKTPLAPYIICGPRYTLVHGYVTEISGIGHIPWGGRQIIKEITFFFEHLRHQGIQKFDFILRILSVHIIYRILFLKQLQKLSSLCHYWSVRPNSSTEFFISISFKGYRLYDRMFKVTETFTVYLTFAHFWHVSILITLKKEAVSSDVITDQLTY